MQLFKITERIKLEIQTLNKEEKAELRKNLDFLVSNIKSVIGLNEPLYLIVDTQIMLDFLLYSNPDNYESDSRRRFIRKISVSLLFNCLLSYLEIDVITLLTPTIFYEINQRNIPKNNNEFEIGLKKCLFLMKEFEAKTSFYGLYNFKVARQKLQHIEHDEQKIIAAIKKFKQQDMTFSVFSQMELRDENNERVECRLYRPPYLIANQIIIDRKIRLKYYDRNIINRVVASHLEPKIYSDSVSTAQLKQQFKKFRIESIHKMASVSKIVKGKLKGLADIEILQFCNIASQFSNNTDYTLFAVSFDEKLLELLKERTRLNVSCEILGQDDTETRELKLKQYEIDRNRLKLAKEKLLEYDIKFSLFHRDIAPLLD